MKTIVLVACLLAVPGAFGVNTCLHDAINECGQARMTDNFLLPSCNAVYGNYGRHGNVAIEMQAYANLHIERSYQYLLSAAYFNNYQTNRAGFTKLFKKLSDDTWAKSIELIKHITMRGDEMDFTSRSTQASAAKNVTIELQELGSLAHALDTQKEMAERAFHIHREATRNNAKSHDPEIAQYLEEEFVEYQAKLIRDLAGHTTDLKKFIVSNNGQDLSLALYLFDEYLQKVV
ncbi:ferritin light chain [Epargyreus clarus]|uniref:ferritin light chain n=1 Tax=Epargyreus clarus TaxID=520877 RepID=UPI003C2E8FF9